MPVTVQSTPVKVNIYVSGGNVNSILVNPMTNSGDMIYGGVAGAPLRLPIGSDTQVLTVTGGLPTWAVASGLGMSIGGTVTSGTPGSVLWIGTGPVLAQDNNNFYWNSASHILNVNTGGDQSGTDSINVYSEIDAYQTNTNQGAVGSGTESGFTFSSSRGTGTSPLVLSSGDLVGGISGWGYTGASPAYKALAGTWVTAQGVSTDLGGQLEFWTKSDNGSLAQRATINPNGILFVGNNTTPTNAGTELINVRRDANSANSIAVLNATSGTTASSSIQIGTSSTGGGSASVYLFGLSAGFTTSGLFVPNTGVLYSAYTGGLNLGASAGQVGIWTNNLERARFLTSGEFLIGYTTVFSSELAGVQKNQNANTRFLVSNTTSNTAAQAQFSAQVSAGTGLFLTAYSSSFTTAGINVANTSVLSSNISGGLNIATSNIAQVSIWTNSTKRVSIDAFGNPIFTQGAQSSAWGQAFEVIAGAHTGITASTELMDVDFQLNRNVQWLAGTVATQRQIYVRGVTLTGAAATAIFTNAYTLYVDTPVAGTNATITNSWAAGFAGNVQITGTILAFKAGATAQIGTIDSNSLQILANNSTKASISNTGAWVFQNGPTTGTSQFITFTQSSSVSGTPIGVLFTGGAHTNLTLSTESQDINFNLARTVQFAAGAINIQRAVLFQAPTYSFVGASTITDAATVAITGAPIRSTNATFTNTHGLLIQSTTVASAGVVTNSFGLTVNAMLGATNNYSAQFLGGLGVIMDGQLTLGSSANVAVTQTIQAGGSGADISLQIFSKGQGNIIIGANGNVNIAGIGTTGTTIGGSGTSSGNPPDNTFKGTGVSGSIPTLAGRAIVVGGSSSITGVAGGDVIINGGSANVGNANGGNVYIAAGNKIGTGVLGVIQFQTVFGTNSFTMDANKNFYGQSGTTGMTNGFIYIPSAAGAPTGTPTSVSGTVPMYYDSTNNNFYVYNGAWKKVLLT